MKRFHVHLHVDDLNRSIGFYSQLFAAQPARVEGDYAKWMLEDPPVNFAISTRGNKPGIDHLGIQSDCRIPVFHEAASVTTPITAPACCTASPRSSCC